MIDIPRGSKVVLTVLTNRDDLHICLIPVNIARTYPEGKTLCESLDEMRIHDDEKGEYLVPSFMYIKDALKYIVKKGLVVTEEWQGEVC